jgi:RNA polymerase-binding protein DksA
MYLIHGQPPRLNLPIIPLYALRGLYIQFDRMEANNHQTHRSLSHTRPRANTSTILGSCKGKVQIDPKWNEYYESLLRIRDQLQQQKDKRAQTAAEACSERESDPADGCSTGYELDLALGKAASEQNLLNEIDEALERIRIGTYGICQLSGEPIPAERLRAVPWTRFNAELFSSWKQQACCRIRGLGKTSR